MATIRGQNPRGRGRGRGTSVVPASPAPVVRAALAARKNGPFWVPNDFPREIVEMIGKEADFGVENGTNVPFSRKIVGIISRFNSEGHQLLFINEDDEVLNVNEALAEQAGTKDLAFLQGEADKYRRRAEERDIQNVNVPATFASRAAMSAWVQGLPRETRVALEQSKARFLAARGQQNEAPAPEGAVVAQ